MLLLADVQRKQKGDQICCFTISLHVFTIYVLNREVVESFPNVYKTATWNTTV